MSKQRKSKAEIWRNALAGNYCKLPDRSDYQNIVDVRVTTQPSEVYGAVSVQFMDGSWHNVYSNGKFWPAIKDVGILTVDEYFERIWPHRNDPAPEKRHGAIG